MSLEECLEVLKKMVYAYVCCCYRDILERDADREGTNHYVDMILEGKIKVKDLPEILKKLFPNFDELAKTWLKK